MCIQKNQACSIKNRDSSEERENGGGKVSSLTFTHGLEENKMPLSPPSGDQTDCSWWNQTFAPRTEKIAREGSQQGHLRQTTATMLLNIGRHVKIVLGYLPRLPNPRTHLHFFVFCDSYLTTFEAFNHSVETTHIFFVQVVPHHCGGISVQPRMFCILSV